MPGKAQPADLGWLQASFPDLSGLSPLAQGGQKIVISARHRSAGEVVLKIIDPRTEIEAVQREILAVQQVQSIRVPRILDQGTIATQLGTCVWLIEERISGQTVRELLKGGAMPPVEVFRLGLHVLEALERAESVQIVHRDVKPDNIMRDESGNYWLLDFGIARHLELSSLTASALPFGKMTPGYAPPEQCRNVKSAIDSRADLFALGVTLHECATGVNGFFEPTPRDPLELLQRVERYVLTPLRLPLRNSGGFADLISAMTQKNRIHRPRSVKVALTWLRELFAGEGFA